MILRFKFPVIWKNYSFYFKRQYNIFDYQHRVKCGPFAFKRKDEKPPFYLHTRQTSLGPNDKNIQRKI